MSVKRHQQNLWHNPEKIGMMPTVHLFMGIVLYKSVTWVGLAEPGLPNQLLIIGGSVFLDLEWPLVQRHKRLISHTPLPWLVLLIAALALRLNFWLPLAVLIHLMLDSIDWGVMVFYPFSQRLRGPQWLANKKPGDWAWRGSLKEEIRMVRWRKRIGFTYSDRRIVVLELIFAFAGMTALLL